MSSQKHLIPTETKLQIVGYLPARDQFAFLCAMPDFVRLFPSRYYNRADEHGFTILHELAKNTTLEAFPFQGLTSIWKSLDLRCTVKAYRPSTPLMLAIKYRNSDVLEWLVKEDPGGLNVNSPMHRWWQCDTSKPRNVCCTHSDTFSALHYAVHCEWTEAVKVVLEKTSSIDVNAPCCSTSHGQTALQHALRSTSQHKPEIVRLILNHPGCDVTLPNDKKNTLLHLAIQEESLENVHLLVESPRVDVNARNGTNDTPLTVAVDTEIKQEAIAMLLAHKDIDPRVPGRHGFTILIYASSWGYIDIMKALLSRGDVDIDQLDEYDQPAILHACKNGEKDAVRLLLDHGARVGVKGDEGAALLGAAKRSENAAIVDMVRDARHKQNGWTRA